MTMFLSMLTGDAASRHGHEFSPQQSSTAIPSPPAQQRRLPLTRSPLSFLPSARQRSPHGPSPLGPGKRALPPRRSQSLRVTMAELREEPGAESEEESEFLQSVRMPGAYHGSSSDYHNSPALAKKDSALVVETEIVPEPVEVEVAQAPLPTPTYTQGPVLTEEPEQIVGKRTRRPRTAYRFAHPPPPTRPLGKKGIIRPRVLLQLQQRSDSGFHKPIYEVVPASRYAPVTKVGHKLQRMHKGKDGLAADDLVVVQAEEYKASDPHQEDVEISDSRDVLGMISSIPGDFDSALISLENSTWKATARSNGAYTLVLQGEHSQTARWYIPKAKRRKSVAVGAPVPSPIEEDHKFYFTTILPDTTKHPTIASMTSSNLEVYDEYTTPTAPDQAIVTDDLLRKLITVSGAWVFFREGWAPSYKINTFPKPPHNRTASMPVEAMRRCSTFSRTPTHSPTPMSIEDTSPSSLPTTEATDSLRPPKPSPSPLSNSSSEKPQSDGASLQALDGTSRASSCTEQISHFKLPRTNTMSNLEDKSQKRRSWNHYEMPSFGWPATITSLGRRVSIKRNPMRRDSVDPTAVTNIAPPTSKPSDSKSPPSHHLRRVSQNIRRPITPKTNVAHVEFSEVHFGADNNPHTPGDLYFLDRPGAKEKAIPAEETPVATVVQSIAPVDKDHTTSDIHVEPAKQEIVPIVNMPIAELEPKAPEATVRPVTPQRHRILPVESTETLVSAVKYTYWQQYDRLMTRHLESPPESPPPTPPSSIPLHQPSPDTTTHQSFLDSPVHQVRIDSEVSNPVISPRPVVSAPVYEPKVSWKEKLKSKLHH